MPTLSVIIPATNGPRTLDQIVESICRATSPPEEMIVIDGPPQLGPAAARNIGADRAKGEVIVFIDADVDVHPDVFVRIRRAFDSDTDLVGLFGSYDDDPQRHGFVSDFRNLLHHYVHHQSAGLATTFWAGIGAVRREVFLKAGGFDEGRFPRPSVEDIEFGMRLAANGQRVLLDPRIQGQHLKRWTLLDMIGTDLVRRGIPWVRLLAESQSASTTLNLGWRHRASAGASVFLTVSLILRKPRGAVLAGGALYALNAPFYRLLLRRRGLGQAAVGIPLHALHHLAGAAAVPGAALVYLQDRIRRRKRGGIGQI